MDERELIARRICAKRGLVFVEQVGEGAFKQTFKVLSKQSVPIALKVYKSVSSTGRDEREIKAMLKCQHENIARVLSVEKVATGNQQHIAITEEFFLGGTLGSKGQLSPTKAKAVGVRLIDALGHLAELNLVHRDIKPENIMFREDRETPILTDFGVVRDLGDSSMTPTWAPRGPGTPFFAAPEQLNNEKSLTDWRTDQFALGVTLAFSIYGEHPYRLDGLSASEVVERVAAREQPGDWFREKSKRDGVPVLIRMVAPWPVDRYRKPKTLSREWDRQKG